MSVNLCDRVSPSGQRQYSRAKQKYCKPPGLVLSPGGFSVPRHICHGSSMDGERSPQCWTVARFDSGPWYNAGSETPAHMALLSYSIYRTPRKSLTLCRAHGAIPVGKVAMQAAHLSEQKKAEPVPSLAPYIQTLRGE